MTLEEQELMVIEELKSLMVTKQIQIIDENSIPKEIQTILAMHGKTAKFWVWICGDDANISPIHQKHHSGDLEIYISMLPKLTSLFFTFNHHNYAR